MRVLHPMGYDAFGLPAENNAIKTGEHPREATEESIASFQRQFRRWGISIDWSREFGTHEPRYYRWTQWIFLQLFERGLAYRKEAAVNWCPKDATVLANEQVIDGHCERCGTAVELRQLEQWFFRITDYADRLLDDLDDDRLAAARQDDAAQLDRPLRGRRGHVLRARDWASTTPSSRPARTRCSARRSSSWRPSTPTCCAWPPAPSTSTRSASTSTRVLTENNEERADTERKKTGVPLGRSVVNPVNGEQIPMYVADYVLMEYGTGAIMAVPGHDERDFDFATAVRPADPPRRRRRRASCPYTGDGPLVNSSPEFDGLNNREALEQIVDWLDREGKGHRSINYRLRDWLLSRQRYWGAPIPIVYCDEHGIVPVPEDRLPVELPDIEDFAPQGQVPAGRRRGLGQHHLPDLRRPRAPRDGHDGHVRRLLLVLPALHRRQQRRGRLGPEGPRQLDAGRPVHRRRRARDPAPDVRALLREGAGRPRPAGRPRSRSRRSSRRA